ncbi:galectin-4-like [Ciona intestinalis]
MLSKSFKFAVNLRYGDNVGFHFNPRFDEDRIIVLNNKIDDEWQSDERKQVKFPFEYGENFTIMILCGEKKLKVFVNQKYLLDFKHRVELYKISDINVTGAITVHSVMFGMMGKYPESGRLILSPSITTALEIPFPNIKFHEVTFIGKPQDGKPGFAINFFGKDNNEIAFHLNLQMEEKQIVRNSLLDNQWGNEDRSLEMNFPFTPNAPFMVMVKVDKKGFTVMLNGFHLFHFAHRFKPLRKIRSVDFRGDVDMNKIIFN